jgi:hypothetical protein
MKEMRWLKMVADRSCVDFKGVSIDTDENREDFLAISRLCQIALLNFGFRDKRF